MRQIIKLTGLATLKSAQAGQLSFLANALYRAALTQRHKQVQCCYVPKMPNYQGQAIIVANPYAAYAQLTHYFDRTPKGVSGIHPQAVVSALAQLTLLPVLLLVL
jgi:UDP-3-O-[3-hydroxymyristoyl] glucosamine N-acyltransferase